MKKDKLNDVKDFLINKGFELLDNEYLDCNTKINIEDTKGYKYYITFHNFKSVSYPKKFHSSNPYTLENIKTFMKNNDINYTLISDNYINMNSKLNFICDNGHEFSMCLNDLYQGIRCKECHLLLTRKTHEQFELDLFNKYNGEYSVVEKYKNNRDKILFLHNSCGTYFKTRPFSILSRGDGCPLCAISKGERKCIDWLNKNNFHYEREYIFNDLLSDKNAFLRYDFAVFINNIIVLIEYDGEFHYRNVIDKESFYRRKMLDKQKNKYALDNNISLIRIPYWEYENIEKILSEALLEKSNSAFYIVKGS